MLSPQFAKSLRPSVFLSSTSRSICTNTSGRTIISATRLSSSKLKHCLSYHQQEHQQFFSTTSAPKDNNKNNLSSNNNRTTKSNGKASANKEGGIKFQYLILIGLFSYVGLSEAAKRMEKNKDKNSFSEEEFNKLQDGLRRKTKMIPDDIEEQEVKIDNDKVAAAAAAIIGNSTKTNGTKYTAKNVSVYLVPSKDINNTNVNFNEKDKQHFHIIDAEKLTELEKNDIKSRYGPLLQECERFGRNVPVGTKTAIVGNAIMQILKQQAPDTDSYSSNNGNSNGDNNVVENQKHVFMIVGFPDSINEAIKFEEKVVTVKKLISVVGAGDEESSSRDISDVVNYYDTVKKVAIVSSAEQIKQIVN